MQKKDLDYKIKFKKRLRAERNNDKISLTM